MSVYQVYIIGGRETSSDKHENGGANLNCVKLLTFMVKEEAMAPIAS